MPQFRRPQFTGLFSDETNPESFWIRETGELELPPLPGAKVMSLVGEIRPAESSSPTSAGGIGLVVRLSGQEVARQTVLPEGEFKIEFPLPASGAETMPRLEMELLGVQGSNLMAWLGRVTNFGPWQKWRRQARNRRLRLRRVMVDGETVFDCSKRNSPWNTHFIRRHLRPGMNLAGFFRADLGLGESVRCMARAAAAAHIATALVDLKLPCLNPHTDDSFAGRLQEKNPFPVNIFHLDAPVSPDIDHHHGEAFRQGKYNIGYWAWELPEFPDAWVPHASYFDEIWTPSRFTTEAIAAKLPQPVVTMPHAISFARPHGDFRRKFGLPTDKFLFLFLYDLNSYSERKNPAAVIEAFRRSTLAGQNAALVIKVHNVPLHPADFEQLREAAATLPGTTLITQTLSRTEIYELESACDCFVSLHRSEGFGLALAECMYIGKPVIATDWSGSTDFIHADNACPVRNELVTLDRSHGPYSKGQIWAAPDLDHAAWWMQRLVSESGLAQTIGEAARASIEKNLSPVAIGARYRTRLEAIATW